MKWKVRNEGSSMSDMALLGQGAWAAQYSATCGALCAHKSVHQDARLESSHKSKSNYFQIVT
jgi:hypothetical protein